GRAVSAAAGEPYQARLLALPPFLLGPAPEGVTAADVAAGLALTEHFLLARVLRPRDLAMPEARNRLLSYLRPNV
ncbi:MAG TPA: DNA repair protein RecO, partial [Hyphomicrobiaceae bacterium]|nr:DNA repair protein RecO [Hyphomicrobiaceae bacterium]